MIEVCPIEANGGSAWKARTIHQRSSDEVDIHGGRRESKVRHASYVQQS